MTACSPANISRRTRDTGTHPHFWKAAVTESSSLSNCRAPHPSPAHLPFPRNRAGSDIRTRRGDARALPAWRPCCGGGCGEAPRWVFACLGVCVWCAEEAQARRLLGGTRGGRWCVGARVRELLASPTGLAFSCGGSGIVDLGRGGHELGTVGCGGSGFPRVVPGF